MKMEYDDLARDFVGCVLLCIDQPVYINEISRDCKEVIFTDLITQKLHRRKFVLEDFLNPLSRLGFINVGRFAVFAKRIPIRKFYLGLNKRNVRIERVAGIGELELEIANQIATPQLALSLLGEYPSLTEAVSKAIETKGCCAFDRQFAVGYDLRVYYKTARVGSIKDGRLNFLDGFKHLILLLDNNHEKDIRNFGAAISSR